MTSHLVWVTCRATGLAALLLSSAAVGVGVSMSGRLLKGAGPDLRVAHEALSIAVFALIGLHALSLLGDSYFHPSVVALAVPFARNYREPYMALGIIAGWCAIVLGLSFYVRDRIGIARWRILHRFTGVVWALSIVHAVGEGSDTGQAWFIAVVAVTTLPTLLLVLVRLGGTRRSPPGSVTVGPRVRGSGLYARASDSTR